MMADEIQGWELAATLKLQGQEALRQQLAEVERQVEQTQRRLNELGRAGPGVTGGGLAPPAAGGAPGGTAYVGGRRMGFAEAAKYGVTAEDFIAAGGGGGGGRRGGGMGGGTPPSGNTVGGAPSMRVPPSYYQGPTAGTGASAFRAQASYAPDLVSGPSAFRVAPSYAESSVGGPSAFRAPSSYATGNTVGVGASAAEGLVARSNAIAAKEAAALAKASKDAAGSVHQFGLRTAWVLRSATSGGPLGLAGGVLGAGTGLLAGNPAFGALLGNYLGQSARSGVQRLHGLVGMNNPAATYQFDRAVADVQGVLGRGLTPALDFFTRKVRQTGDFLATNETKINAFGKAVTNVADAFLGITGINRLLATGTPGASAGAAISPLAGKIFGSLDEFYHAAVQASVLATAPKYQGPTVSQQQAEAKFQDLKRYENIPGVNIVAALQTAPVSEVFNAWNLGIAKVFNNIGKAVTFGGILDEPVPPGVPGMGRNLGVPGPPPGTRSWFEVLFGGATRGGTGPPIDLGPPNPDLPPQRGRGGGSGKDQGAMLDGIMAEWLTAKVLT